MMIPICIWCATLKSGKYVFLFKGLSFIGTENICKHFLTVILQCSIYNHSHWSTYNVIEHQILFFICNWISFQWINLSVISIVLIIKVKCNWSSNDKSYKLMLFQSKHHIGLCSVLRACQTCLSLIKTWYLVLEVLCAQS